ncbi:MAG: (Fe-S)-binding protein, partial [Pseudomonadota bacterium]
KPVNKYLPPRPRDVVVPDGPEPLKPVADSPTGWLGWLDRTLEKL